MSQAEIQKIIQTLGIDYEELAKQFSEKLASIVTLAETIDALEKTEEALVRALIASEPFQRALRKLEKYTVEKETWVGFHGEKLTTYRATIGDDWLVECNGEKCTVKRIEWPRECNEYGTCWTPEYAPYYVDIRTLSELMSFVEAAEAELKDIMEATVRDIKSALTGICR